MLPSMIPEASSPDPTPAPAASAQTLMAQFYTQLRRRTEFKMAHQPPGQTIQATAVVHEFWPKLSKDPARQWANPRQFFATAAEAMRQIFIDRARRRPDAR